MNRIDLTQAEWQLMEKLWEHAPQTGRELTEAMAAQTGWNRSTTLTLLRRLMEKGAVRCDAQGRKNVFYFFALFSGEARILWQFKVFGTFY